MEEQQVQHIGETVSGKGKRKGLEWVRSKDASFEDRLEEQTRFAAEEALKIYRSGSEMDYKLDVPLNSNGIFRNGFDVIHVNFTAKVDSGSSSHSHKFFAEIIVRRRCSSWQVIAVEVIDPADEDNPDKISKSCTMCSEKYRTPILHPDGHYMFGEFDDIFYNSTQDDVDDDDGIF